MLRNYFKIAFRNFTRNSVYSFINIAGLAIGIACSVLIALWVWDEISYDRNFKNADRLGQVWVHNHFSDNTVTSQAVPLAPYEFLKTYDSRIKNTCILQWPYKQLLTINDTKISATGQGATPEFLQMFQFPFLKGSAETALRDASSIVLTESLAKLLFGDADPMNKTIRLQNQFDLKVSGILEDLPSNSSFEFKFLTPWAIFGSQDWVKSRHDDWQDQSFQVLVELQPEVKLEDVNANIKDLVKQHDENSNVEMFIHPLSDWHLRSNFKDGILVGGYIEYVKSFSFIAIFILAIACINFMNLATAKSEHRAREVGIRKSVGSRRSDLIAQFIGESIFISTLAFLLAIVLVELALPLYNNLVGKRLFIDYTSPFSWLLAISLVLMTGFFAGSYPAFYLSAYNPARVLKGKINAGRGATTPRKILVSLQFIFTIFLIVGMLVIYQQTQFVKARETGYDRENMIIIESNEELNKNYEVIDQKLLTSGVVNSITTSSSPVTEIYGNNTLDWPGKPEGQDMLFSRVVVGYDYTKTLGIEMIEGRDFSEEFKSDSSGMLLNKTAVDAIGLNNPIGAKIKLWSKEWTVLGVIDDVVMSSPFRDVQPGFFLLNPDWAQVITIKLNKTADIKSSIATIESIFKELNPSNPFEYNFVDAEFDKKFSAINLVGQLTTIFALLAIVITCLGLFGLATFTAEQRTKEIGIRKVMGASNTSIVGLISKDFAILVLVGFMVAAPIAWWAANNYLDRYTYRIEISWWIIPIAGLLAMALTLLIVSIQAFKAASANPTESLRSE